jgi:hypothetical protein
MDFCTISEDFYWLGSVPCRSVLVVAMVVGIQVLEKRIIYTRALSIRNLISPSHSVNRNLAVDDGTAVIEVMHTPGHASSAASTSRRTTEPHAQHTAPATSNRHHLPTPPLELRPVATIGDSVRTIGRIITWFDSRRLKVDKIGMLLRIAASLACNGESCRTVFVWKRRSVAYHEGHKVAQGTIQSTRPVRHTSNRDRCSRLDPCGLGRISIST